MLPGKLAVISHNQVCRTAVKCVLGLAPGSQDESVRQPQLVEHGFHHIDIAACQLPVVVHKLVGRILLVAYDYHRSLAVISVREVLRSRRQHGEQQDQHGDDFPAEGEYRQQLALVVVNGLHLALHLPVVYGLHALVAVGLVHVCEVGVQHVVDMHMPIDQLVAL